MRLVQSRIPDDVCAWIEREAARRGLSVAAWLREHLILEHARETDPDRRSPSKPKRSP